MMMHNVASFWIQTLLHLEMIKVAPRLLFCIHPRQSEFFDIHPDHGLNSMSYFYGIFHSSIDTPLTGTDVL